MAYKRTGSPFYQCRRRRLPGYGDSGVLVSQVRSKKVAERMERLLEEIAEKGLLDPSWRDLLDAVCRDRTITLPGLLAAKNRQGGLDALRRGLHDPLLSDAIDAYEASVKRGRGVRLGFDMLRHYALTARPQARLSYLSAKQITLLCRAAESDPSGPRKRNSVRRTMLRAISLLLRHELGRSERDRLFADVDFPAVDDSRDVNLTQGEIRALLTAATELGYDELGVVIRMALQTSADRGVLLRGKRSSGQAGGLRVRDLRIYLEGETYSGEVYLADAKTSDRPRTVPLTDSICRELLLLSTGKQPDDPVFTLGYSQLDFPWKRVRKRAGLEGLRFKDLRSVCAIYGEQAGVPLTVMSAAMGHADKSMTRRYQQHGAVMTAGQAAALEAQMGLAKRTG